MYSLKAGSAQAQVMPQRLARLGQLALTEMIALRYFPG